MRIASHKSAPAFGVHTARGTTFALFDGEATLFCESTQKLYALNPIAAVIWCSLEEGGSPQTARARLVEAGVHEAAAQTHVEDAVRNWLGLGLLVADFPPAQDRHTCAFHVGGRSFSVETPSQTLSHQISALFGSHASSVADANAVGLKVIDIDGSFQLICDESNVAVCKADELLPAIKAWATEQIVTQARPEIMFHAACMEWRGRTLLISGAPGAGKTTLALQLGAKGFGYGGDDITLISPDGLARGIPFAPTVKSGAWDVISRIRPELLNLPIHRRADDKEVRYLESRDVAEGSKPVGWIIFIRRDSGAAIEFTPVGALEAMRRLIEGAYSRDGCLSLAGFDALRRLLAGAKAFELTYEFSTGAADALTAFCNDGA